jgi:16S rRNA (guanine966-N2)-methyltransferase
MQIISGYFKGKKLYSNKDTTTRPLTSRLKITLFDILSHHIDKDLTNYNIIDCFAGFGTFALECLSRGSQNIYLIENNQETLKILSKNLNLVHTKKNYLHPITKDFFQLTSNDFKNLNPLNKIIIFLDPPYSQDLIYKSIEKIISLNIIKKDTIFILKTENTLILNTNQLPIQIHNHLQKKISSSIIHLLK